jgi:acyl-CoA reductase-like NAD-dependent aldehyde dehydrogenase
MTTAVPGRAGMLIDGEEVGAAGGASFATYDPSTEELVAQIAAGGERDVDRAVAGAGRAFASWWPATAPRDRAAVLYGAATLVRSHADELVELDERTAGLPTRIATADVETAARYLEYYAGIADKLHGDTIPLGENFVDYTEREPWGVCAVITPFNVPLQLNARSIAPALACGNTVVVKPAEQAPLPAIRLAQLITEAGGPAGLVNVVTGTGPEAGTALVAHPGVGHITFTGSLATGQAIMRGAAEQLTPVTLELGGKSPQIAFEDADLEAMVAAVVATSLMTAGQVCSAGTRILAHREIASELRARLVAAVQQITLGEAHDGPDMGPLISRVQRERVLDAIATARSDGARVLAGGGAPEGHPSGFFVEPTVLGDVTGSMRVAREEVFGPVIALMEFAYEAEAIEIANDSEYGLVAGIWTEQLGRAHRVARAVRTGQVFVNNYGAGGGIELPFGGYRKSGIGREKGLAALDEYLQTKNVCVRIG